MHMSRVYAYQSHVLRTIDSKGQQIMDGQPAETVEVLNMSDRGRGSNPSPSSSSSKRTIPINLDFERLGLSAVEKDLESSKLRRPVRPVDRQRMRPWLMELLDLGNVYGLSWTNRNQGVFQISWRHASRLGWNLETDGDVFERWARHTGIYKEGDPPEPKRWKANFRCALHSLHDVVELTTALERRGRNACRTYRFLHSSDERSINRKRAKARKAKEMYERRDELDMQEVVETQPNPVYEFVTTEIVSNEDLDLVSESESEEDGKQDRVIVQKLAVQPEVAEEEFGLHHDHDYSAVPDKSQKTIVLRQGIGSIVLHKEVLDAPESEAQALTGQQKTSEGVSGSNLEQLASAAVSTAGWSTILAPGIGSSPGSGGSVVKQRIRTKLTGKEITAARLMKAEDQRAAYNLKYLLTGNKEDAGETSGTLVRPVKKRKAESVPDHHHASISVGAEETVGTESTVDEVTGEMFPFVPQKVATKVPRRTASPRILSGAKARRQRSKSERADSESTEPLMSSCLLLLEAATRLDNAEKDKTGGVRTRSKGRGSARINVANTVARGGKSASAQDGEASDDDSESSGHTQAEDAMIISADHQDLHRVLRKTLESLKNRNPKLKQEEEPAITLDLAEEPTEEWVEPAEPSEAVVVVSEGHEAKGIFSGSSIKVEASPDHYGEGDSAQPQPHPGEGEEAVVEMPATTIIEETVIEGEQGAEYIVIPPEVEESVTYVQTESVPGEIIIESAGNAPEEPASDGQAGSETSKAFLETIPPGSVLLQTGDGTPIGVLDANGKLTAFQSPEARSVISVLTSRINLAPAEASPITAQADGSAARPTQASPEAGGFTVSAQIRTLSSVPLLSTAVKTESPKPAASMPTADVVVKLEPPGDPSDHERTTAVSGEDAAVKVERVDPGYPLVFDQEVLPSAHSAASSVNGLDPEPDSPRHPAPLRGDLGVPCLAHSLLLGLASPFSVEGMTSNVRKALLLHRAKSCSCPAISSKEGEVFPSAVVRRLEDLCKSYFVRVCLSSLSSPAPSSAAGKPARRQGKITVLPFPTQRPAVPSKESADVTFGSQTVMDPTAPLSIGEIPLFASAKGDSDSMSPPSE